MAPLGHTAGKVTVLKAATCTEPGESQSVCTVCGEKFSFTVESLGHNLEATEVPVADKPGHVMSTPTCVRCGYTEPSSLVHKEWTDGNFTTEKNKGGCVIASVIVDTCTLCGEIRTQTIPAPGHSYAYQKTKNDGTLVYSCGVCGNEVTRMPSLVSAAFKTNINQKTEDILIEGYIFDVTCDGIVNAKDYAVINHALIRSKAYN